MSIISDAIKIAYPAAVCIGSAPFVRPEWTNDRTVYTTGFYWENLDGDRFYFDTYEEAAEDLATDMAFYEDEARAVLESHEATCEGVI